MNPLAERVTSQLQKIVGAKLIDVELFCFEYEADVSAIELPTFYFGGEVILKFDNERAIITWDENAGWQDHFSLYVGCNHLYLPSSTLITWNVSQFRPWLNCIDQSLISAQVYGYNQTPHIVEFNFENTTIYIGDGREMEFGDGDDIIVTTNRFFNNDSEWNKMWGTSIPE